MFSITVNSIRIKPAIKETILHINYTNSDKIPILYQNQAGHKNKTILHINYTSSDKIPILYQNQAGHKRIFFTHQVYQF